jgi:hypothetical protein
MYMRVLWRFRILVGAGVLLATALAVLSFVRINPGGSPAIKYRSDEQWSSESMLFVTQQGFPWGRLSMTPSSGSPQSNKPAADNEVRFSSLAVLYAYLASSDQVRRLMLKDGPINGQIAAEPVMTTGTYSSPMPLVRLIGIASTPARARALVIRVTDALRHFLASEQAKNQIGENQRVLVSVVKRADTPKLFAGRSMTLPIVVFLGVMILISGLAFMLENMRGPRRETAAGEQQPPDAQPVAVARDAA